MKLSLVFNSHMAAEHSRQGELYLHPSLSPPLPPHSHTVSAPLENISGSMTQTDGPQLSSDCIGT